MATPESNTGKTIFVLAIVVGCFAVLWPRVFHPMVQTAFSITKPQTHNEKSEIPRTSAGGCCDVVHDYDINNNFFARLCELVVHRQEMIGTGKGVKSQQQQQQLLLSKENRPGVTQMCREKILELCHVDIGTILTQDSEKNEYKEALEEIRNQNVSYCLRRHYEKHEKFVQLAQKMRRRRVITTARKPAKLSPILHPAMRERGVPIATRIQEPFSHKSKSEALTGARSGPGIPGRMPVPNVKGSSSGSMGFIMPMYTVGIVVFFVYTVMKYWKNIRTTALVLFKRGEDRQPMMKAFNVDPEYRKFVLNQNYSSTGSILSYHEYLKEKEREEKLKSRSLLEDDDQEMMFTAIEGIIAEMDDYRERININDEEIPQKPERNDVREEIVIIKEPSPEITETKENSIQPLEEHALINDTKQASVASVQSLRDSLQAQMSLDDSDLLPTIHEDSRFAVVGVETTAVFEPRASTPTPQPRSPTPTQPRSPTPTPQPRSPSPAPPTPTPHSPLPSPRLDSQTPTLCEEPLREIQIPLDVPNIILETNIPSDSTVTVSESQERIPVLEGNEEGENGGSQGEEDEEQPVIIAGKMTISLIDTQANHVESSPGSSNPSSPSGNRNFQENSFTFNGVGDSKEVDDLTTIKDIDILENVLLSSDNQAPAAASEESTIIDEIIVAEEIITEETTTTEYTERDKVKIEVEKDEIGRESNEEEEEEEEEEDDEDEDEDEEEEEVIQMTQEKPDPPPKEPPSHIQQNWL